MHTYSVIIKKELRQQWWRNAHISHKA